MSNVSLKSAYHIFPHFLRTISNDDLKEELNALFVDEMKKIPFKNSNIISQSKLYSDLFKSFIKEIESNIEYRIKNKILSLKKTVKRGKEKQFQIIGVVRRLKIEEMARFKYACNFGVQKDTVDYIINHIFKKKITEIQERLDKIQTE